MEVDVYGYAVATAEIREEEWDEMSRVEREQWAKDVIQREGTPEGVSVVMHDGQKLEEW